MKQLSTLLALFFLLTACSQAPQSADPSVITSRSDTWENALNAKDVDTLVELYTSDSRLMPPNAEAMIGHDIRLAANA